MYYFNLYASIFRVMLSTSPILFLSLYFQVPELISQFSLETMRFTGIAVVDTVGADERSGITDAEFNLTQVQLRTSDNCKIALGKGIFSLEQPGRLVNEEPIARSQ